MLQHFGKVIHRRKKPLFAPVEQVEINTSRKFQGIGLGLALTRKIVELHGGRIQARSEGKEKGAIFEFTLPICQKHEPVL